MKKVMILAATVLVCMSFASCEQGVCTCKINNNGTKSTIKYDESELQKQGAGTCESLGEILERTSGAIASLTGGTYKATCR